MCNILCELFRHYNLQVWFQLDISTLVVEFWVCEFLNWKTNVEGHLELVFFGFFLNEFFCCSYFSGKSVKYYQVTMYLEMGRQYFTQSDSFFSKKKKNLEEIENFQLTSC